MLAMAKRLPSNQTVIITLIAAISATSAVAPIAADALPDELSDQLVQQVTDLKAQPEPSAPLILISQSELDALPMDTVVSWSTKPTSPEGPTIEIASPTNNATYEGSFPIKVDFRPGPKGYEVDIESLKLEYKKAWGIDITDRVREFITGAGIDVENSELPKGRHTVEIEIADIESNLSRRIFTVTVK